MAAILRDWRIEFMRAHPRLFHLTVDEPEQSFGYPNCKDGWRDILERLCARIEGALQDGDTFEFVRIKQKFGLLRVYWYGEGSAETAARIDEAAVSLAEARSACTCETCGAEGRHCVNRGWLTTACAEHAAGEFVPERPGSENIHLLRRTRGTSDMYYARYDREADTLTEVSPRSLGLEE